MQTSAEQDARGRDLNRFRPRAAGRLIAAAAAATGLIGVAVYASVADDTPVNDGRSRDDLVAGWAGESGGQQVLGGERVAGRPAVQRMVHDGVQFTVSVAPARPGPNLVRVDTLAPGGVGHGAHGSQPGRASADEPVVRVGTADGGSTVDARPRPGTDGLWAVVNLPRGSGTVLVSHGPEHRIPFVVSTGQADSGESAGSSVWTGPDGPECLAHATGALISGSAPSIDECPSEGLSRPDHDALTSVVRLLAERGAEEVAVDSDGSPRSRQALAAVRRAADEQGVRVVTPDVEPHERSALLELAGWSGSARHLAAVSSLPLRKQPIRSDGTWLAPWLLSPGVVDSTAGAVIPLGFDIRDATSMTYSQTLAKYLPGHSPTASGFAGWRGPGGTPEGQTRLYAASRAAYMPGNPGHAGHETTISWFPGGTITPVGNALTGS
jgi:hypothetical protein